METVPSGHHRPRHRHYHSPGGSAAVKPAPSRPRLKVGARIDLLDAMMADWNSGTRAAADLSTSISRPINGTGLVQLQLGTSDRDYTTHLYYQDSSGAIRDMQLQNYEWVEASYDGVQLTANARNGTPFAVGSYSVDNVVHLTVKITPGKFHIDSKFIH